MSKTRGRPFPPGNTLGRGRPKGSRNKEKSPGQYLPDEYAPHIVRKCLGMALQGDRGAMRICMERISPARQDACIRMNLATIRTAQDVGTAAEKVTQAIGRGNITPIEGGRMINILEGRSRIIERVDLESRLEKLEEKLATNNLGLQPRLAA
jgi:predicted DNA-binding protein (UPF0251 family)